MGAMGAGVVIGFAGACASLLCWLYDRPGVSGFTKAGMATGGADPVLAGIGAGARLLPVLEAPVVTGLARLGVDAASGPFMDC